MFKINFKKLTICITSIAALSTIAMTLGSCSGVSSSIKNNMVTNDGKGNFATGAASSSLSDEVLLALNNKTSSASFTKRVANEVLYAWYNDHAHKTGDSAATAGFYDNWTKWNDDANKEYDDKIDSYKSQHKADWPYYFQNEVMDPIGATSKSDFVKNSVLGNVRTEFDNLVFGKSYLGISSIDAHQKDGTSGTDAASFQYYNPDMPVDNITSDNIGEEVLESPYRWQDIDFYATTDSNYDKTNSSDLSWQYAYMQHYAFQQMLQEQKPLLTSMTLWKYTDGSDAKADFKFGDMYNTKDIKSTDDQKIGYQFPYFQDGEGSHVAQGPNHKFQKFVKDGFTGSTPSLFFDEDAQKGGSTGLISIPVSTLNSTEHPYTDDQATLFKTNLGTDNYTSSYTVYAGTANALWNAAALTSGAEDDLYNDNFYKPNIANGLIQDLPQTTNMFNNTSYILNNFLYTDPTLSAGHSFETQSSDIPATWKSNKNAAFLGTKADGTVITGTDGYKNLKGLVNQEGSYYSADIFSKKQSDNYTDNPYYKNGFLWSIPGFQLHSSSNLSQFSTSQVYKNGNLPFAVVRDDGQDTSGVHVIGLDGSVYLTSKNEAYSDGALGTNVFKDLGHGLSYSPVNGGGEINKGKIDLIGSQERENDIIRIRGLQAKVGDLDKEGAGNLDFSSSTNNEVKNYWTANEDRMILEIAEKQGDYGSDADSGSGDGKAWGAITGLKNKDGTPKDVNGIFDIGKTIYKGHDIFDQLYNIIEIISLRNLIQTAIGNFTDSNKKIMDLYKTQRAEADNELQANDGGTPWNMYDIYKNGLTSPYPYTFFYNNLQGDPFATDPYIMDATIINSFDYNETSARGIGAGPAEFQNDFFHGTQSLFINPAQQFFMATGKSYDATLGTFNYKNTINTLLKTSTNAYVASLQQKRSTDGNNQYSEHIIVDCQKNPEVNDLLNTFGSDTNFTNNVTLQAYDRYLNHLGDNEDFVMNDGTFNYGKNFTFDPGSAVQDALTSQYYGKAVLGDDANYDYFNHSNEATSKANIVTFSKQMFSKWYTKNITLDSTWGSTDDTSLALGSSSNRITYYKMMAAMKYLTSDSKGNSSNINFAKWLNSKISYANPYYMAWTSKDWSTYRKVTDDFVNKTTTWNASSISAADMRNYQWKNNYANQNDTTLLSRTSDAALLSDGSRSQDKTYISNSNYYQFAKPNGIDGNLMGYKGLVSGSGDLDNEAGDLLINHFNNANPFTGKSRTLSGSVADDTADLFTGALAQYGSLGKWVNVKDGVDTDGNTPDTKTLTGYIYSLSNSAATSQLLALIKKLQTLLPNDSFKNALSQLNNGRSIWSNNITNSDNGATAQALINMLYNVGNGQDNNITSSWTFSDGTTLNWDNVDNNNLASRMNFEYSYDSKKFVLQNPKTGVQTQLNKVFDPITKPVEAVHFSDTEAPADWTHASMFSSSDSGDLRVAFSQVTYDMVNPEHIDTAKMTNAQAEIIVANAYENLGASNLANLFVQAAQDTNIQTSANRDVLTLFQAQGKVTVYDRRFNDLLGANWVKDYKEKN